MSTGHRNQR